MYVYIYIYSIEIIRTDQCTLRHQKPTHTHTTHATSNSFSAFCCSAAWQNHLKKGKAIMTIKIWSYHFIWHTFIIFHFLLSFIIYINHYIFTSMIQFQAKLRQCCASTCGLWRRRLHQSQDFPSKPPSHLPARRNVMSGETTLWNGDCGNKLLWCAIRWP